MAKKVVQYQFSHKFKREYKRLPAEIRVRFDEKLILFLNNMSHSSLRVKRLQGTRNRWEGSVTESYRFTFEFHNDMVLFRAIGTHDILIRESRSKP